MPQTINGVGTWYYGRRREHRIRGVCEHCKQYVDLHSYDTTLYLVVLFVPVLPLAGKRILGDCSRCRMHRAISLKDWERSKAENVSKLLDQLAAQPSNRDVFVSGLGLALAYQDQPFFEKLGDLLPDDLEKDAEVLALLADGYAYFSQSDKALAAYAESLAAKEDHGVREQLGLALLRNHRPAEAEEVLRPGLNELHDKNVWIVYWLVEGYMAQGLHDDALRVIESGVAKVPALGSVKELKQLKAKAEKHRSSGKPIASALLADANRPGYREGGFGATIPKIIAFSVLFGLAAWYLGTAWWMGQNREIHLLNGLDRPYVVQVQGNEVTLLPDVPKKVLVTEGEVAIVPDAAMGLAPSKHRITTNFFARPFQSPVYLLNPDRVAMIEEETGIFAVTPQPSPPIQFKMGQAMYHYASVDYFFQPLPRSLSIKKGETVTRLRLGSTKLNAQSRIMAVQIHVPKADQPRTLKLLATMMPKEPLYLFAAIAKMPPGEATAFVKPRLGDRPILVEWHRVYQSDQERSDPDADLRPEYDALVKQTQGAADAIYLRARLELGSDAEARFREAAAKGSAHASYALGFNALSRGDFSEAERWLDQALKREPANLQFAHRLRSARLGLKKWDELLEQLDQQAGDPGQIMGIELQRAELLAARGDTIAANAVRDRLANQLALLGPQAQNDVIQAFDRVIAIASNNVREAIRLIRIQKMPPNFHELLLQEKRTEAIASIPTEDASQAAAMRGLLYLTSARAKDAPAMADDYKALLTSLNKGPRKHRLFAAMLESKEPLSMNRIQNLNLDPNDLRILLRVASVRRPEQAKDLMPLAQQLTYDTDVECLCLRQLESPK